MTVVQRLQAPTPKFFKLLRNIGLVLAAMSGAVMASPITLPKDVITIAGYVAVAGSIMTAVSQAAVKDESEHDDGDDS